MIDSFSAAIDILLRLPHDQYPQDLEASDDRVIVDSGGATKFGISKRAFPDVDIERLTISDAMRIYKTAYWNQIRGDELPHPLDIFVFDAAVNQGEDAAVRMLQECVGVAQDGVFGRNTMAAVLRQDNRRLPWIYLSRRARRYVGTRSYDKYGQGWFNRLFLLASAV